VKITRKMRVPPQTDPLPRWELVEWWILAPQTGTTKWRLSRRCLEGGLVRPVSIHWKSPVSKPLAAGELLGEPC